MILRRAGQKLLYPPGYTITQQASSAAPPVSSLLYGLAAYWSLDEASDGSAPVARLDSTAYNNDLSDNNTTPSAAGKIGNAAAFTAANQEYLYIADNASLSMSDHDFMVCGWVYLTTKATNQHILNKWVAATANREYALYYDQATDRFRFIATTDGITSVSAYADAFGSPSINTWYFFSAYHNSETNFIYISINNGAANSGAISGGIFNGNSNFVIGALIGSIYGSARVDEVGVWKRLLTSAEQISLYNTGAGLSRPFGGGEASYQVIFDGNSMTDEDSSTYPSTAFAAFGGVAWLYCNFGISGQITPTMTANAPTHIDPLYDASLTQNIVIVWEGTNDLKQGATAAAAYANLVAYCQARQAAGWTVIILTILPRSGVGTPPTFNADRATINTNIRNNYATFAAAVADVAANTDIGEDGDSDNPLYYSDGTHMTTAGYNIVAGIVAATVNGLG